MFSSGIQLRKGVVVTSESALGRAETADLITEPEKSITATVAGRDPATDLAVLRIQGEFPPPAELGDSLAVKLGQLVLAVGRSPRGHLVASSGIVGGLSGEWRTWRGGKLDQHIRLDLEFYPGFSGGALLSHSGKVLGVNSRGVARGRPVAIPVSTVNRVVDELLEKGHIARPHLGLAMQPVAIPEGLRSSLPKHVTGGLMVVHAEPGGPADKGGVVLGDVLAELNGKPVEDLSDVMNILASATVDDTLSVSIVRGGQPLQLKITLSERSAR